MHGKVPLLFLILIVLSVPGFSQRRMVRIRALEIDGKPARTNFRILVYANGRHLPTTRVGNGFYVPSVISNYKTVTVRIIFGRHDLVFDNIYVSKFDTDWIVGVDQWPFDSENVPNEDAKTVKFAYYLQFVSHEGDDTKMVVMVHKRRRIK